MSDAAPLISIGLIQLMAVISPGPSFLITAQTAVARGRAAGIKVAAGLSVGTIIWSTAALFGLTLLFKLVPPLFVATKLVGAAFLLWVAWKIFRHAAEPLALEGEGALSGRSPFLQGVWTQLSNPKTAIFFGSIFVALLPREAPLWLLVSLIVVVTFNEMWWYSAVSLFFSSGPVRRAYLAGKIWLDRVVGLFLGALGLRLLWGAFEHR